MNLNILQKEYDSLCRSLSNKIRDRFFKAVPLVKRKKHEKISPSFMLYCDDGLLKYRKSTIAVPNLRKYYRLQPIRLVSQEYITMQLPKYGKALERYLETGKYTIDDVEYSVDMIIDSVPYWDILLLAMDVDVIAPTDFVSSHLEPGIQAFFIKIYRQLTLYFYKTEVSYSNEVLLRKQYEFITNDQTKKASFGLCKKLLHEEIKEIISEILNPLLSGEDFTSWYVNSDNILEYKHATFFADKSIARYSGGAVSNAPSVIRQRAKRYADVPKELSFVAKFFDDHFNRSEGDFHPSKLEFVPKDGRGPRMIAEEPDYMGLIQSYFQEMLYTRLKDFGIDLNNQDNNRFKALSASLALDFATIDMKNASDNILVDHIHELFPVKWVEILKLLRSPRIELKDTHIYELNCFATMGNKLTFPIQTIIFYAIALASVQYTRAKRSVLVYGDDVIVPTKAVNKTIEVLESWGFDVNKSKTFSKGCFRESCGIFAYKGYNVNCIYRRKVELTVEHINELLADGLYIENDFIKMQGVESCVNLPLDLASFHKLAVRWNVFLQHPEIHLNVHRPFVLKDDLEYPDETPLYDEWLRSLSCQLGELVVETIFSTIRLPRIVDYKTRKDVYKPVWVRLDISNIPIIINDFTLGTQIWKDYSSEPYVKPFGVGYPCLYGDIDVIDFKIKGDNMWNKTTNKFNTNYEMFGAITALNKKVDAIKSTLELKGKLVEEQLNKLSKTNKMNVKAKSKKNKTSKNEQTKQNTSTEKGATDGK